MKRYCALLMAALTLVSVLTGCVHEDLTVTLNDDGTGAVAVTIGLRKDFYDQISELGGDDPFEGKETTEIEYEGKTYVAFTETKEYGSFEEIEKALADMKYETEMIDEMEAEKETDESDDTNLADEGLDDYIFGDFIITDETEPEKKESATPTRDDHIIKSVSIKKNGSKYTFDAVMNALTGTRGDYDMSDIFSVSIAVVMPGKISACEGGTAEGNKVTFDLNDMSKELTLHAESKTTSIVPIIIGAVVVVAVVGAIIILRRKKK